MINVNNASKEINDYIRTINTNHKFLTDYQAIILNYFNSKLFSDKNILLLWLAVGRGKTLTSLSCAIAGINSKKYKQIVILSPKSIQDEFLKNLNFYFFLTYDKDRERADKEYNKYLPYFKFVPYNAWNAYEQFKQIKDFEDTLYIIDEAHLFMKSIIKVNLLPSEAKKANIGNCLRIYKKIKRTKNKKILALTGTPCAKTPFELIPMINLAYEKDLFALNIQQFEDRYIDYENNVILREKELINKFNGLIAYVPPLTADEVNGEIKQVKATDLIIEEVEMSENQFKQYIIDYEKEKQEVGFSNKRNIYGIMFGQKSSFHAKTFEDCIYWNSELRNIPNENRNDVNKIIIDKEHTPKILKMYEDSKNIKGKICYYFRFTNAYGVSCMEECLKMNGYRRINNGEDVYKNKDKRYVIFSGDIDNNIRNQWKDLYNNPKNKYGEYIKYMILSPSATVGITLRDVRFLGIGSVEFNYSNIRQILGRCNRLNSHKNLPENERTLINKIYIMTKNEKYYAKHKTRINEICDRKAKYYNKPCPSIERIIYEDAIEDDKINEAFKNNILKKASITEELYK